MNVRFWQAVVILALSASGAQAQSLHVEVQDLQGHALNDAVVIAVPTGGIKVPLKPHEEIVDQIDREFVPYVKPILVGSMVRFPNKDNIRHHVYSFSPAKPFELPLYKGTPAAPVLFDKAGVVVLGCNIHDWMVGYVYVSESPYYAKSGPDGLAVINEIPKGEYRVRIWHPDLDMSEDATARTVAVDEASATAQVWQIKITPGIRVQRAPTPGSGNYH